MNPSGRGKLSVPYRSPDGEHCSMGCPWIERFSTPRLCSLGRVVRLGRDADGRSMRSRQCRRYSRRNRPRIVCLAGSTRFYESYQQARYQEVLAGHIVLGPGVYPKRPEVHQLRSLDLTQHQQYKLLRLQLQQIELCDELLVINVGDYVGSSTRSEIAYAQSLGKKIRWLEPHTEWAPLKEES